MNKKEKTIETYNKSALALTNKFNNLGSRKNDIKLGLSYFNKKKPVVLEVGCGNGRDAKEITKYTNNYLGIDVSSELIKIAKKDCPKCKFKIVDVEKFKFPKNIDIIFSFASLIHSSKKNLGIVLNRAYSALNENGVIYLSLKYGRYRELTRTDEFGTRTYYYYSPTTIKKLTKGKYSVIKQDIQNFRNQKWLTIVLRKI